MDPATISESRLKEMLAAGSPLEQDYASAYLRGDFHEKVVLWGGNCSGCSSRVESYTTRAPLGVTATRVLPQWVTKKQVLGGMTCDDCGSKIQLEYTEGAEGGPLQYTEVN